MKGLVGGRVVSLCPFLLHPLWLCRVVPRSAVPTGLKEVMGWMVQAKQMYKAWGILFSLEEAEDRVVDVTCLGCHVNGLEVTFRLPFNFQLKLVSLTLVTVREPTHILTWSQIVSRRWSWAFQYLRSLSGCLTSESKWILP